ncbi:6,7-dimethyl-8-ribityllumazine synthase [Chlamydiota bacterium]
MKTFEGHYGATGHKYGIVISRFNQPISQLLLEGTIDCLKKHGVAAGDIAVAWVPGAFEIPGVAHKMAASKKYDCIICVGAVIRGETSHFDYVAGQAASGIMQAGIAHGIPVIFSVLTTENIEQAVMRTGTKGVNVGFSNALGAIEMVNLYKSIT